VFYFKDWVIYVRTVAIQLVYLFEWFKYVRILQCIFLIFYIVTARTEFDSRTGEPEMDIDWTFGDYSSLYAKERGLSYVLFR
jgi:hypothetical protein